MSRSAERTNSGTHGMPAQPDTDVELMLRCQAGDESCFERLVERHKQQVLGLVYRFLGGPRNAEDVAQKVFLRVWRARRRYKPKAKFTTWLYAICRNTCFSELKKHRRMVIPISLSGEAASPDGAEHANEIRDDAMLSPLEAGLRDEQAEMAKRAIDSLPDAQRMAVVMRCYEQLPYEDIALAMGCSAKAVKSLLHRARVNLRNSLAEYLERP